MTMNNFELISNITGLYIRKPDSLRLSTVYKNIFIMEDFSMLLSAGIDNNETLKVHGSGGADPEGTQPGDLYVNVKV